MQRQKVNLTHHYRCPAVKMPRYSQARELELVVMPEKFRITGKVFRALKLIDKFETGELQRDEIHTDILQPRTKETFLALISRMSAHMGTYPDDFQLGHTIISKAVMLLSFGGESTYKFNHV